MSIVLASEVEKGDLIKNSRDNAIYYVHDLTYTVGAEGESVDSFIAFPVREHDKLVSGTQSITLETGDFKNVDGPFDLPDNAVIAISEREAKRLSVDADNYYVANLQGKCTRDIIAEADNIFAAINGPDVRLGDLSDADIKFAAMDYSKITGPVYENVVDGDRRIKPKEVKLQKAKSLVNVPDIYLEDAYELGFIDKDLYKTLVDGNIFSLRGALSLVKRDEKIGLAPYVKGARFEELFAEEIPVEKKSKALRGNRTLKSIENISIFDGIDQKLLTDEFTVEVLSSQGISDDFDPDDFDEFDDRLMLVMGDAFEALALQPQVFEELDRPNQEDIPVEKRKKLTKSQVEKVKSDLTGAFNKVSLGRKIEDLSSKIETAYTKFSKDSLPLLEQGKAFMIHDPAQESVARLSNDIEKQRNNLIAKRPAKLKL